MNSAVMIFSLNFVSELSSTTSKVSSLSSVFVIISRNDLFRHSFYIRQLTIGVLVIPLHRILSHPIDSEDHFTQ